MGKDWGEKFRTLASICAVVMFLSGPIAFFFHLLPFANASDFARLEGRVSSIETGFKGMSLDQKQSLELQLMQQIDSIDVKLKNMAVTGEYTDLRSRRVELNQRLTGVRQDISSLRGSQ